LGEGSGQGWGKVKRGRWWGAGRVRVNVRANVLGLG